MEKERKKKQNVSTLRFEIPSRLEPRSLCFQFCEVVAYQETRFILRQTNRSGFYDKYFFSCFNDENCVDCASEFKHLFFNPFPAKCQFVFQIETSPHFVVIDTILKFIKNTLSERCLLRLLSSLFLSIFNILKKMFKWLYEKEIFFMTHFAQ